MQNYGVIAEISDRAFHNAVERKSFKELVEQKIQENFSVLERLEVPNTTAVVLRDANPADLKIHHKLSSAGKFGDLFAVRYKGQ